MRNSSSDDLLFGAVTLVLGEGFSATDVVGKEFYECCGGGCVHEFGE